MTPICRCVCVLALFCAEAISDEAPRKKLIEIGWDIPSTRELREHWQEMERAPFDGVIFKLEVEGANSQAFWNAKPWKKEWVQAALDDLKACAFKRFTHNFVRVNSTPGNVDWFNDADWTTLTEKTQLVAWLAHESGCKGICLDPEPYGKIIFRYDASGGRTFKESAAVVRKRGGQFMAAIKGQFPNATVLSFFLNSQPMKAGDVDDPQSELSGDHYGLLPAFVDGMLDSIGPEMTLVDGCECAYRYDDVLAYLNTYNRVRTRSGPAMRLVSPENRAKYQAQVQVGFGFYLDCFLNAETSPWYIGGGGGSRLERLRRNLALARQVCDEYVWVYGEQCRWWKTTPSKWNENAVKDTPGKGRLWEEAMPGITRAIRFAGDPVGAAREEIADGKKKGTLKNLIENASFEEAEGSKPKAFSTWQAKESHGTFSADRATGRGGAGSAKAVNVTNGCFLQKHEAKAGETYVIEADCLRKGGSACSILVRWQTKDGRWTLEHLDQAVSFLRVEGVEWEHASGVVTVPAGAEQIVILLRVAGQSKEEDACWFDDVGLYKLE
ncbi:MAG TPA: hypothetical protein VGP72_23265 [Planctomycetota bacterium]|jgi:hypothetical protein